MKLFRTGPSCALAVIASLAIITRTHGFADGILGQGDRAVIAAPEASFASELQRWKLPAPAFQAVYTPDFFQEQTNLAIELADLRDALLRLNREPSDIERTVREHRSARELLSKYIEAAQGRKGPAAWRAGWSDANDRSAASLPGMPPIAFASGLPEEFADYLEGTIAWNNLAVTNKSTARFAWERLLNRPPSERHYKSTWAAYMLGRSWEKEDPEKASAFHARTRHLARGGFRDSLGLAVASLGREAKLALGQTNYVRAIDLYLQQMASGDESAQASLVFTMRHLFRNENAPLEQLARDSNASRLITSYIISTRALRDSAASPADPEATIKRWLRAADVAGAYTAETSEALALAAYQAEDWDAAQLWINRAGGAPVAQWLQAKLWFRTGQTDRGGALLSRVAGMFPLERPDTNEPIDLKDHLTRQTSHWNQRPAAAGIRGELAIFYLSRGDYVRALELFLEGEFWMDAAYVAERVLTLDELKAYVDQTWSLVAEDDETPRPQWEHRMDVRARIRYLLGRRLLRDLRGNEAREYFPDDLHSRFDGLVTALLDGWNEALPTEQRARALATAAGTTRTNGIELLATEIGPDWHIWGGRGISKEWGRPDSEWKLIPVSADERRRATAHRPDPDVRFHYRYQAAFLIWEAARLMPDNSEETARLLCLAGSWLKAQDPETADLFYKAMVRRNRKTAMGDEADRLRWFPTLDKHGRWVPRPPVIEATDESEEPLPEFSPTEAALKLLLNGFDRTYLIQPGDTLPSIAMTFSVSLIDLLEANPDVNPNRLVIGQKLEIPIQYGKED